MSMRNLARRTVGTNFATVARQGTSTMRPVQQFAINNLNNEMLAFRHQGRRTFATHNQAPGTGQKRYQATATVAMENPLQQTAGKAEKPRLFCGGWADSTDEIKRYRMGGIAMFCGMLVLIHPWFSLSLFRLARANKIKKEEAEYKRESYAAIQDKVAARHKTKTKFRVHKKMADGSATQTFPVGSPGDAHMGTIGKFD